ncbi:hypothetical protein ABPG72_010589 [Tetrahymena utriculariae]
MDSQQPLEWNQMPFQDKLKYLKQLTDDQLYDLSHEYLNQFIKEEQGNLQSMNQNDKKNFQNLKKDIEETISDMNFQLDEMKNTQHSDSHQINKNLVISYKIFEKTNTVSIRAEAELDIPWFNLVALVYEIDLFKNWFPFCKHAYTIKKPKKGEKIGYFEMNLPFISNREAYIQGVGIDRLEVNGTILIKCKTIHDDQQLLKELNINLRESKNVQIKLNFFACEIFPVPGFKNKVKITTISNVDPKVKFLPKWMINFFAKKFGTYLMEKIFKLASDIKGTDWEKAINAPENQEFYQWVSQRVQLHEEKILQKNLETKNLQK